MDPTDDTIAAIATPIGTGGVGIVRMSGSRAREIAARLFRPRRAAPPFESHRLYLGMIADPRDGHVVDEILLSYMAGPHSYTKEDVVEMNCHGGPLVVREILSLTLRAGARLAEPGEFTRRAFLNGRIDLAQAEAVSDLIESKSAAALRCAASQLQGGLSREVECLRVGLLSILSELEASIDFPEEDLASTSPSALSSTLALLIPRIEKLVATYQEGHLLREGASVTIAGNPNAGKSSLFNALLGADRAIVTPLPGTTRDFIEEAVTVNGIPLKLVDTAGLRDPVDTIEEEGIRRTSDLLGRSDLVLLVVDGSVEGGAITAPPADLRGKRVVVVVNKADLPQRVSPESLQGYFPGSPIALVSALCGQGIHRLMETLSSVLSVPSTTREAPVLLTRLRHRQALEKTAEALRAAREGLEKRVPGEFISTDMQLALHHLGEIAGQTTTGELLDTIFSRFCVGK